MWPTSTPIPASGCCSTRRSVRPSTTLSRRWPNAPGYAASTAQNITVDGFEGKQIEFTVPDYDENECREGRFGLWKEDSPWGVRNGAAPDLWAQTPGQHNRVWILDVDGTRLTILTGYPPNTSAQDRADLEEILGSIRIG